MWLRFPLSITFMSLWNTRSEVVNHLMPQSATGRSWSRLKLLCYSKLESCKCRDPMSYQFLWGTMADQGLLHTSSCIVWRNERKDGWACGPLQSTNPSVQTNMFQSLWFSKSSLICPSSWICIHVKIYIKVQLGRKIRLWLLQFLTHFIFKNNAQFLMICHSLLHQLLG